ncbi:MAG: cadmium-translocating P-type ATPase [Anaerolineales bacterium]|nr:cadmium-translocating P-type ATPase [Anaerolineales bacterium]
MNEREKEPPEAIDDDSCIDVITEAVEDSSGIVSVHLDTQKQQVTFDYDPRRISDAGVEAIAASMAPTVQQRWETCTMRLGKRGGRACESCAVMLEKRLHELPGVRRATASYLGGVLSVSYDGRLISPQEIAHQVRDMGLPVAASAGETAVSPTEPTPRGLDAVWAWLEAHNAEAIFTAVTLVAMLAGWLAERVEAAPALVTSLFVVAYVAGGTFGLRAGLESLRHRTIDVDLLMILAALGAAIVGEPFEGAMLLFLFSLSNVLQDFAMEKTRSAISALMDLRPATAAVRRGSQVLTLPIEQVRVGDRILVKPGERIALDGVVTEGESSIDQSSITGESMPVDKKPGDAVFAGTINKNGSLEIGVTRLAQDSTLAKLIKLVEEAHSEKAETQRFIDTAEQYYAIGVIALTALAIAVPPLLLGEAFATAFYRAMTIMVAASPCALVISTPATVLSAIGNGARRGILFKGGVYVENAATVKALAFDKTGTLTAGKPEVTDIVPLPAWEGSADDLLALVASAEARSEHPLARAAVDAARAKGLPLQEAAAFQAATGKGIEARVGDVQVHIGNLRYFEGLGLAPAGLAAAAAAVGELQAVGKTAVVAARIVEEGRVQLIGVVAFADVIRPDAPEVIRALRAKGIEHIVMLTGDNRQVAERIAAEVGVDAVYADLLPEDKVSAIKEVQATYGPVAMVGDGVNDAPALATAAIGIAMGAAGTDVALETADVVLMSDDLRNLPYMIGLSHKTRRTLWVNLGFSLFMIVLMLATIFASNLPLPLAVIGHEGGTVLVSLNGLRLLAYRG